MNREDQLDQMLEELRAGTIGINLEEDTAKEESGEEKKEESKEESGENNEKKTSKKTYKKEEKENSVIGEILSWVEILVGAAVIAFFINTVLIANSRVPTGSMISTIMPGDRVIGSRLSYKFGEPQRGDIAIFIFPDDEARGIKTYYVKRVIGMPGDTIDIVDGELYLNGSAEPLEEPYIEEPMMPEPPMHFEVPEDSYFMLGDNRNYSSDSRRWKTTHYVQKKKMIAKVLFQYFPKLRKLQ